MSCVREVEPRCYLYNNTTKHFDIKNVVQYILQYADGHAILLPGRIPGYRRYDLQLLPSSTKKRKVWLLYHNIGRRRHKGSWLFSFLPESTCGGEIRGNLLYNVCVCTYKCIQHNYIHILSQLIQALHKVEEHLLLVTQECSVYREVLKESKRQIMSRFVQGVCLFCHHPTR